MALGGGVVSYKAPLYTIYTLELRLPTPPNTFESGYEPFVQVTSLVQRHPTPAPLAPNTYSLIPKPVSPNSDAETIAPEPLPQSLKHDAKTAVPHPEPHRGLQGYLAHKKVPPHRTLE
jgi:hypothetical protein